jgi:hypothetical protein
MRIWRSILRDDDNLGLEQQSGVSTFATDQWNCATSIHTNSWTTSNFAIYLNFCKSQGPIVADPWDRITSSSPQAGWRSCVIFGPCIT